jgi:hypothetical protein
LGHQGLESKYCSFFQEESPRFVFYSKTYTRLWRLCRSTIVKLLLRLYDPDSGSLFLDDHDLRSLSQVTI